MKEELNKRGAAFLNNPNLPLAVMTIGEFQHMLEDYFDRLPSPPPPTKQISPDSEEELVSVAKMAKLANISRTTLYNGRKGDRIPFYRIGKRIMFRPSEVLSALKQA